MRKGALLATLALLAGVVVAPGVAADPAFTVRTMHFDVLAGPGAGQHCDIVGDLYTPASAGAASPAPAILATNGFGGAQERPAGPPTARPPPTGRGVRSRRAGVAGPAGAGVPGAPRRGRLAG